MKGKRNITELFDTAKESNTFVKVCAPMVRYSKLQFRTLVKRYGVDMCFTPMILADSFCQSSEARANEFTTNTSDGPLIAQFAAKESEYFIDAAKLVYPYVDGVDLNCGCPQRWALKDGYGCSLMLQPQTVYQLVRESRNCFDESFSISVKMRIFKNLKETINICRQLEKCGVTFLTVHGRTQQQKSSEDVNVNALNDIKKSLQIPLIANGGVKTLENAKELYSHTSCDGIMAANGLLTNPALFYGYEKTPQMCIRSWYDIKNYHNNRISFQIYHHHLVFMLEKILTRQEKRKFNYLTKFNEVDEFLDTRFGIKDLPKSVIAEDEIVCNYVEDTVKKYDKKYCDICSCKVCNCIYSPRDGDGKYFESIRKDVSCDLDYMEGSLFDIR